MAVTPAIDVGGFGRLAEMKIQRRAEEREERRLGMQERSEAQRYRLGQLQLQQMESNLQKSQRQAQLRQGLNQALSNIPEGENRFTTAYNYYMHQNEPELAMQYAKKQSDDIEQVTKLFGVEAGANLYKQTLGKAYGIELGDPIEDKKYGKVFEATDTRTGKVGFIQVSEDGDVRPLKGYAPPSKAEDYELKDKNLNVINALAGKVKSGKATQEEIQTYTLAESDYTQPKRFSDPKTGELYLMQPKLPKGIPTFKPKEEDLKELPKGHKEPLLSPGGFSINPISDPERITKTEVVKYRQAADSLYIMRDMLTELKDDIETNGLRTANVAEIARRKSVFNAILMRYKEVLNLGVLNGPDLVQMSKIIKDPATPETFTLGEDWVIPGYENVLDSLTRELNNMHDKTGGIVGEQKTGELTAEDYLKKWSE